NETMARNVPLLFLLGGLTLNVATISALAVFRSTGKEAGETSHPCGAASLSSPLTAPVAPITRTETGLGWFVGNTKTLSRTFPNTGGAITNGRGSSPATASDVRYFVTTMYRSSCPFTCRIISTGRARGFSGRPISFWSSTAKVPIVPGLRSQYGCEYGVSLGILEERSFVTSSFDGSASSILFESPALGNRTSCSVTRMFERLIASSFIAAVCPGVNLSVAVDASTCKPRHAALILPTSAFFSAIHDSC